MMQMKSVYIETTIPSLATSRTSRDPIVAGHQAATLIFWEQERSKYDLVVSQYVIDECSLGDNEAAAKRMLFLKDIPIIPKSEQISSLADKYQLLLRIPDKAKIDCFHLAACVLSETHYLLSWNCAHLGIHTYARIVKYNGDNDFVTPLLVTPEALINL
jgi:hypothetical protein